MSELPVIPDRWQTLAVNQRPSGGVDYPLAGPSADVRGLLGDLFLACSDGGWQWPLRIAWLYGFGAGASDPFADMPTPTHTRDILILDAADRVVFDSTAGDYLASSWGHALLSLQWTAGGQVLRLTAHTDQPLWAADRVIPLHFAPQRARLDPRTVLVLPRQLNGLIVNGTRYSATALQLSAGYNLQLESTSASPEGGRRLTRIRLRARPGDGLGQAPGCNSSERLLKRINGAAPAERGDLTLDAAGCYRVQWPVAVGGTPRVARPAGEGLSDTQAASALSLHNNCGPCCTCNDYLATYAALRRLYDRFRALGSDAEAARDSYAEAIERWERQRACRRDHPLKLVLAAEPLGGLFVGGLHCNSSRCCLTPLHLRTTLEVFVDGSPVDYSGSWSFNCREAVQSGTPTSYLDRAYQPIFRPSIPRGAIQDHIFAQADPQSTSRFRNRWKLPLAAGHTYSVRVTLTAHSEDATLADGTACPQSDPDGITIPAAVAALWASYPPAYPIRALLQQTIAISNTAGCGTC